MRRISALMLGTALVFGSAALAGCSSSGGGSSDDGTDGTTATDGTNGTDGTDGTDGTNGTNGTEGTDGTDGTEGTTGTPGTDATDCEPFCQPGWKCGDDGCGGICGDGCSGDQICNNQLHQCEDPPDPPAPAAKYGERCGPTLDCNANLPQQQYQACLNGQCEEGLVCLESLGFGADGMVCSKQCSLTTDQVDAEGNPGPDGIEDAGAVSDCAGAENGPYGSNFTCVAVLDPSQGNPLNLCQQGTTFKNCGGDSDCPTGESCQLRYIMSGYRTVCVTAVEGGVGVGSACNGDPLSGDLATCNSNICFGFGCGGFCNDDNDCLTDTCEGGKCADGSDCTTDIECSAFECIEDQTIFSDEPNLTWNQCRGKGCEVNADCKAGYHCIPFVNGAETVEEYDWDFACGGNPENGSDIGGPCGDDVGCNGLCLNSGVCSGICKTDADCANDTTEMICGSSPNPVDVDGDGVDDKILPLGLCFEASGSKASCFTDADCTNTGDNEVCNFFLLQDPETGAVDSQGLCTTTKPGEANVGEPCGGPTGVNCKSGFCFGSDEVTAGYCSTLCQGKDTCPESFTFGQTEYAMACRGYLYADGSSLEDATDNVWIPLCVVIGVAGDDSLDDCSDDLTCGDGEGCIGLPWGTGSTGPTGMDFMCVSTDDAEGNPANGAFGDSCDPTGEDTSVSCEDVYCGQDVGSAGFCTKLCDTDADCSAGGPNLVCHGVPIIERADPADNVVLKTCTKKASCIPCVDDDSCAGDYVCVNVGGVGLLEDRVCAPPCTADADCGSTDGGSSCVESIDADGQGEEKFSCKPTCGG